MQIGNVDLERRVLVVAEIGNNHEGDAAVAAELVERAAEAGADAVKFQTFAVERFVSPRDTARYQRMQKFELAPAQFEALAAHAQRLGLAFLSTPLDLGSADALEPIVDAFKIASGDNTFWPLIDRVAAKGKPVLVGGGLLDVAGLAATVERISTAGAPAAVLHTVSSYPTPPEEAGLLGIAALRDGLDCVVGYSDHTIGVAAAPLAVALGARIVEKHFTLDKSFSDFRDHALSADPPELEELVRRVREAETLLGSHGKNVQPSELAGAESLRRSIVAARALAAGEELRSGDLMWLRPGGGVPPGDEAQLLGRTLRRAVALGEQLTLDDVD